jgi:hypothetical protein
MKRWTTMLALGLCLIASAANARSLGVSGFAGMSIPIVQDDNGSGPIFGLRVPVQVLNHVTLEPFFASTNNGDASLDIGGVSATRSGFDVTSFGANALLTFGNGFRFYPFVGISSNSLKRTGSDTRSLTGFGGGLGIGIAPTSRIALHIRGEATSMKSGGSGRLFAMVTGGVSYTIRSFGDK